MPSAVSLIGATWNTTAGNKTVITPASEVVGTLIVVVTGGSGLVTGTSAVSDNKTGGTYTQIAGSVISDTANNNNHLAWWVRNNLLTANEEGVNITITATRTGDSGGGLSAFRVNGVATAGSSVVRSSGSNKGATTGVTFSATLSQTPLSTNPILGAVTQTLNSTTGVTPGTGYTEPTSSGDLGYNTPANELETMYRENGETSSTISWGNTSAAAWQASVIEIDSLLIPHIAMARSVS